MSRDPARAGSQFFGGRLCLDFANTLDWRLTDDPMELIAHYADFVAWSGRRGSLSAATVAALAIHHGKPALADFMVEIHQLRQAMWQAIDALRRGEAFDMAPFNRALADLPPQPGLTGGDGHFTFDLDGSDLRQPIWPVLWSWTAVLASDDAGRLGSCQAAGCGWYFVDESPNHSRLWCSSDICGNRERARRAYAKRRGRENQDAGRER